MQQVCATRNTSVSVCSAQHYQPARVGVGWQEFGAPVQPPDPSDLLQIKLVKAFVHRLVGQQVSPVDLVQAQREVTLTQAGAVQPPYADVLRRNGAVRVVQQLRAATNVEQPAGTLVQRVATLLHADAVHNISEPGSNETACRCLHGSLPSWLAREHEGGKGSPAKVVNDYD